jgi:uncharacterized protein involved in exopolysaccharide biosynthesis
MNRSTATNDFDRADEDDVAHGGRSSGEMFAILLDRWRLIVIGSVLAGLTTFAIVMVWPPTFTARMSFLPPQQQQSGAAAALSSLGALAGLAGGLTGGAGLKSPADQYIALMQSASIGNRIIDRFKLIEVYDEKYRIDALEQLAKKVRIGAGKKDGLIVVEVDDRSAERSAAIANSYIDELRRLTNTLAISEAQQRRVFFDQQLQTTKERLTLAQVALQSSGFNPGALKAEPKAAAESYARLRAEATAAEVKMQTLRGMLAENAPEIVLQQNTLTALRRQIANMEAASPTIGDADYITRYREFKYQETLFELFARQYELARIDESREGALIQVVDLATPPEKKSKPKRMMLTLGSVVVTALLLSFFALTRGPRRDLPASSQ